MHLQFAVPICSLFWVVQISIVPLHPITQAHFESAERCLVQPPTSLTAPAQYCSHHHRPRRITLQPQQPRSIIIQAMKLLIFPSSKNFTRSYCIIPLAKTFSKYPNTT